MVGGVYDHQGQFVEESTFSRGGLKLIYPLSQQPEAVSKRIETPAIFGGYLYNHFGHFLLESIARVHVAKKFPELPILWLRNSEVKPWQKHVFRTLGLQNKHVCLTKPKIVPDLILGECGFSIRTFFKDYHADFLGQYPGEMVPGRKIWLSRSKLADKHGGVDNETVVEALLVEQGWTIFHSQEHSLARQMNVLATAERIAGFEGSAFHLLILLKAVRARVDIFARGHSINKNFDLIAESKNFEQNVHNVEMEKVGGLRSSSRYDVRDPQELISCLAS
ncbi:Protein of unknown function [Sphingobium sp. AP50]|nr:Protein of unknown function [Sphingobium sp. AP50]